MQNQASDIIPTFTAAQKLKLNRPEGNSLWLEWPSSLHQNKAQGVFKLVETIFSQFKGH